MSILSDVSLSTVVLAGNVEEITVISADATEDFSDSVLTQGQADIGVTVSISAVEEETDVASITVTVIPEIPPVPVCEVQDYIDLIIYEHSDKPDFISTVAFIGQMFSDIRCLIRNIPIKYDLDFAVGNQLDVVGQWIGISRYVEIPIDTVYFSLGISGLGYDEGVWFGPYDAETGLVRLPDDIYRLLLRIKIVNNHWDGSIPNAYEIVDAIFQPYGYTIIIEDHGDLSMSIGLLTFTSTLVPLIENLLLTGKFDIKPAGIRIKEYTYQSVPGPLFALGISNAVFAGYDEGGWSINVQP